MFILCEWFQCDGKRPLFAINGTSRADILAKLQATELDDWDTDINEDRNPLFSIPLAICQEIGIDPEYDNASKFSLNKLLVLEKDKLNQLS